MSILLITNKDYHFYFLLVISSCATTIKTFYNYRNAGKMPRPDIANYIYYILQTFRNFKMDNIISIISNCP